MIMFIVWTTRIQVIWSNFVYGFVVVVVVDNMAANLISKVSQKNYNDLTVPSHTDEFYSNTMLLPCGHCAHDSIDWLPTPV